MKRKETRRRYYIASLSDIFGKAKDFLVERSPLFRAIFGSDEEDTNEDITSSTSLSSTDAKLLGVQSNGLIGEPEPESRNPIDLGEKNLGEFLKDTEPLTQSENIAELADSTVITQDTLRETSFQPLVDKDKAPPIEFGVLEGVTPSNPTDKRLIDQIMLHEGVRSSVYKDTKGIPTIGVGFNLMKPGARELIEGVGADYDAIRSGRAALSRGQIIQLMEDDIKTAVEDAKSLFSNFDQLDGLRQRALVDLSFNLGRTRLAKFKNTIKKIEAFDFDGAAASLRRSLWFKQVGRRALNVISLVRGREIV